jgi:hypothetical protein
MDGMPDLSTLRPDRAEAVRTWLGSSLNECRICGEPVRPIDPRKHDKDFVVPPAATEETEEEKSYRTRPRVMHLACSDETDGSRRGGS